MNIQQARHHVLALQQQGEVYAMLDMGWRYLAGVPGDSEIAEVVLRGLLDVGLGGVARELLQARKDLDRRAIEKWQVEIGEVPAGRVSWAELKETYRANLAVLFEHQPHLAGIEQELDNALRSVHLYRTSAGHFLLSRRQAGQYRQWLPGITDYAADRKLKLPPLPHGTPVFMDGISLGPVIDRVFEATASTGINQSLPMFLVDADRVHLAAWLHVADRSNLLADERVWVFCGAQALQELEQLLAAEEDLGSAPACVINPPGFKSLKSELMALNCRIIEQRQEAFLEVREQLEQRYAQRDVACWREKLQGKGPIMAMTSRATTMLQYSTRDIGHAFEELGHEFHLLIESADHRQLTGLQVARALLEVDPVLFVIIDHLRYEQNDLLFNVPVLSWVQDPLPNLLCERAGASIGPLDFVCGYYRDRLLGEFGYPESQFIVAPFPVSTRTFHDGPVPVNEREQYACDVAYVGHLQGTVDSHDQKWRTKSPPELRPVLDVIYRRVQEVRERGEHIVQPTAFLRPILDEVGIELDCKVFEELSHLFAYRLFDMGNRQETLGWVGDWAARTGRSFRIYGNNWQHHPQLAEFAAGPIQHGEPLRRLYSSARIVLQAIPGGFMHQRTYEAIVCGAAVLVRYTPKDFYGLSVEEWRRRSRNGEGLDCTADEFPGMVNLMFHDAGEFEELAERYLASEQQRGAVLGKIREVVANKYTYTCVVSKIMKEIRQRVGKFAEVGVA